MLTDDSYYQPVPDNKRRETYNKIDELIESHNKLTKQEIEFLIKFDCKTSTFYGLPKIHKSKIIQDICNELKS